MDKSCSFPIKKPFFLFPPKLISLFWGLWYVSVWYKHFQWGLPFPPGMNFSLGSNTFAGSTPASSSYLHVHWVDSAMFQLPLNTVMSTKPHNLHWAPLTVSWRVVKVLEISLWAEFCKYSSYYFLYFIQLSAYQIIKAMTPWFLSAPDKF